MPAAKPYDKRLARERGERWAVEWCKSCPDDGCGGCDIDQAEMVEEHFHTREEAAARLIEIEAKRLDFFGDPTMTHEHWTIDFVDEETGRTIYHWWAEDCDVWRVGDGEIYQ